MRTLILAVLLLICSAATAQPYNWAHTQTPVDTISPYILNEEWVCIDSLRHEGYWAGDIFYTSDGLHDYQFYPDGWLQDGEWWPMLEIGDIYIDPEPQPTDTMFSPKSAPSIYEIRIMPLAPPTDIRPLQLEKLRKWSNLCKWTAIPVWGIAGLSGGFGEAYLSRDGNWDTRSHRSHVWRDVSIYTTAVAGGLSVSGFVLDLTTGDFRWKEGLMFAASYFTSYYLFTRIGYQAVVKQDW